MGFLHPSRSSESERDDGEAERVTTRRTALRHAGFAGALAILGTGVTEVFSPGTAWGSTYGPGGINLETLPPPSALPTRSAPYAAMSPALAERLQGLVSASPQTCTICYYQESGKCGVAHCPLNGCCYLVVPTGCSGSNNPVLECIATSCQGNFCAQ